MKKILIVFLMNLMISGFAIADTDDKEVKDCFEGLNRATFKFNQGLDRAIFEPIAKGYRKLQSPIRTGTGNVVSNLSNLILQIGRTRLGVWSYKYSLFQK